MPFHINPSTKEPYLRLAAPYSNIIITPHRLNRLEDEIAPRLDMLNDPAIYLQLEGPPVPYLHQDGVNWVTTQGETQISVVEALQANPADPGVFGLSPFTCIREVSREDADGHPLEDSMIGDIGINRYMFYELPEGSEERTAAQETNKKLLAGDEKTVWGIGCSFSGFPFPFLLSLKLTLLDFLSPNYHGRGIMTQALNTLIHDWGVPHMKIRDLRASAFLENIGSQKVFAKNGFDQTCILKDWKQVSESRGGGVRSLVVFKWRGETKQA